MAKVWWGRRHGITTHMILHDDDDDDVIDMKCVFKILGK